MMRIRSEYLRFGFLLTIAICAAGCASIGRVNQIETQLERDQLRLYEKLSDAYFMLGYEYYTMAAEAEDARQPEARIRDLRTRAKMYSLFQQDLQKAANELRQMIHARQAPAPQPPSQTAGGINPAPDPAILTPPSAPAPPSARN